MLAKVSQILNAMQQHVDSLALQPLFKAVSAGPATQVLQSAGLAINSAGSALVKTANAVYASVNGVLVSLAAAALPALAGTVTNGTYNVFAFYVDANGTTHSYMGTAGATLGAVKFPAVDTTALALLGFVVIHPTGTGNFVGGTTALDDATVVPNAAYVSITGDFDPTLVQ